jgi:SAM-dependent methyltransferase
VLDVGCGTGEFARRVAQLLPDATVLGVDIVEAHLSRARAAVAAMGIGDRASFMAGDAYSLALPDAGFDLVACRCVLQALPGPERVVAELVRVARPGGVIHLLAEDYGMIQMHPTRLDSDRFWRLGPMRYAERTGTDLRSGRKMYTCLRRLGLQEVHVDHITVDTIRTPRRIFADIWRAWRDGYSEAIARNGDLPLEEVHAHWEDMIACIEGEDSFASWQIPLVTGRKPASHVGSGGGIA